MFSSPGNPPPVLNQAAPDASTPDANSAAPPTRRSRWLSYAASRLTLFAGLGTLIGFLGSVWWPFDLAAHFRIQYVVALSMAAVLLIVLRRRLVAAMVMTLAFVNLGSALAPVWPMHQAPASTSQATQHVGRLKLLHFNVNTANTRYREVAEFMDASETDIIFLQEVNGRWMEAVQRCLNRYTLVHATPRSDNFGIAMFARRAGSAVVEVTSVQSIDVGEAGVPAIEATVGCGQQRVQILSLHTLPPVTPGYAARRDAQLRAAAAWASQHTIPAIVIGDLNATPWSAAFTPLLDEGALLNSMRGHSRDFGRSWPAHRGPIGWLLRIPIDHCLHTRHWRTVQRRLGPALGSDHRPLLVELQMLGQSIATVAD